MGGLDKRQNKDIRSQDVSGGKDIFRQNGAEVALVMTGTDDAHAAARRAYERIGFDRTLGHVSYLMKL